LKATLKEIVQIQYGIFAQPHHQGEVIYLQARHFDQDGKLTADLLPELEATKSVARHLLVPGDLLFCARGSRNFATVMPTDMPPAVASTSFMILRTEKKDFAKPDFIAWWLNLPTTKAKLSAKAQGTAIASIDKTALLELEINLPSLEKQQTIVNIDRLAKRAKQISAKLEALKDQHTQLTILQALATNH
jgi:Type I restriction modification DNA specificity domain